jgi:predicted metal-binding transcription factor (methanogenesis marker protein 9)
MEKEKHQKDDEEKICICWAREGRVMTPREEEILREIRLVREEYENLKKKLNEGLSNSERLAIESKLQSLRARREELEQLRVEAARERMKLLGHEE